MRPVAFVRITCLLLYSLAAFSAAAQEIYAGRYKAIFNEAPRMVPTSKVPDAPLAGNGDIGLTLGGSPDNLCFYLGKNDFWRAWPVYPGGGIAFPGALQVSSEALKGASWYAEQVMDKAVVKGRFTKGNTSVSLTAWVAATHNTVVVEFISNKACRLQLKLWAPEGNTAVNGAGVTNQVQWVTRSFNDTALQEWPCHVAIAMKTLGAVVDQNNYIELLPGKKITITLTLYTSFDQPQWKEQAIREAGALTAVSVANMRIQHEAWWRQFWLRSSVRIGDPYLEQYYYASQYLLACSSRGDKFAPGIWGPFITKDSTAWGGDYHLNYNYQAPYWAAYSSNQIDLTNNFDQPLLDYMPKGVAHARSLLNVRGIYYPVGIGPRGLVTTRWPLTPEEMEKRYGTRENTIDDGFKFLGQKINAVFSVGNMLMRFYSTYDSSYALRVYPYLVACADFWEDYLKYEEGRYVIYMDHFNEIMPRLGSTGNWRDRLGDFNSTLSLGLVKMLFKGVVDMSTYLGKDQGRQSTWTHILTHLSQFPVGDADGRRSLQSVEKRPWGYEKPAGLNRVSIHGLLVPAGVAGPITDSSFNKILLDDVSHWKDKMKSGAEWGNTLNNGIETCFPGAVRVGYDPGEILQYLKERIARQSLSNWWITQGGGGIETLAAVPLTINEMLLQSYEGVVRIFPNWDHSKDAQFDQLRAYGAFLVSSRLRKGSVEYVHLLSEKGRVCVLANPWPGKSIQLVRNGKKAEVLRGAAVRFTTGVGEMIVVVSI
ncbi:trehalose hydrolase [Paraflavitalea soli]|uniref:Trehalose hydrolase n=1 Tax=Paraflavitalea soli TaxID=2315862 RepID=A0A3B7MRU8_9BACT|nr:trehalose hydrolase [Paraflavitalea soli]AXY74335.1 trehalose hydrolase [Paraflavitalea soli]